MSDPDVSKEVGRLRHLLLKMAELAENVEQTGIFESGLNNSITRYNTIVQRLEQINACPRGLFPALDSEDSTGTLGAEATLLAEYLEDLAKDESHARSVPDISTIVSLAPFLGREELGSMVRAQFPGPRGAGKGGHSGESGQSDDARRRAEGEGGRRQPDLKAIVALAPHMDSSDLGALVRAYVSREKEFDPKYLAHLAPFLKSQDLGAIMRAYMPEWFGSDPAGSCSDERRNAPPTSTPSSGSDEPPVPPVAAPSQPVPDDAVTANHSESVRMAALHELAEDEDL